jgi:hypothetical protein
VGFFELACKLFVLFTNGNSQSNDFLTVSLVLLQEFRFDVRELRLQFLRLLIDRSLVGNPEPFNDAMHILLFLSQSSDFQ